MTLRVVEIYPSVQGEGPNVGKLTTFVRFAGCNMKCAGWPCDTPYAIFPELFTKEQVQHDYLSLWERVKAFPPTNVTLTGGEPILQDGTQLEYFVRKLFREGFTVDVFTNGSLREFDTAYEWLHNPRVTIIMDWKLAGSGEANNGRKIREANRHRLGSKDALKFVVKDLDDLREAHDLLEHQWTGPPVHQVYFGAAWDRISPEEVYQFILAHQLYYVKLNVQVHKFVFGDVRGV